MEDNESEENTVEDGWFPKQVTITGSDNEQIGSGIILDVTAIDYKGRQLPVYRIVVLPGTTDINSVK
jgi:hypothetical protein